MEGGVTIIFRKEEPERVERFHMKGINDVPADKLISGAAQKLKETVKPPAWIGVVKSGPHVERAPDNPEEFWYMRCASLLRKLYVNGAMGVSEFRMTYGGRKNRGVAREKKRRAGGAIIRKALQALEKAGLVKKEKEGRMLTSGGEKFLNEVARGL